MPLSGVIQRKFALLDKHLLELNRRLASVDLTAFQKDWGLRLMTVIALEGAGPAATAAEALAKVEQLGVISSAATYALHQYEEVDPAVVFEIAKNHIALFRTFREEIDRS